MHASQKAACCLVCFFLVSFNERVKVFQRLMAPLFLLSLFSGPGSGQTRPGQALGRPSFFSLPTCRWGFGHLFFWVCILPCRISDKAIWHYVYTNTLAIFGIDVPKEHVRERSEKVPPPKEEKGKSYYAVKRPTMWELYPFLGTGSLGWLGQDRQDRKDRTGQDRTG